MTSVPEFGEKTTGTEIAERFADNIRGRVVLITGVSPKSLGGTTAIIIARHEPKLLILASRTKSKLEEVAATIAAQSPSVKTKQVELDFGSVAATRRAATQIADLVDHIDIIIHSAAVNSSERRETQDGLESQFGVNYIGPFLLTSLLTSQLKAAAAKSSTPGLTRVVNVSSLGYRLSPIRFHDYNFEGKPVPEEEEPPKSVPDYMKPAPQQGRAYHGFCAYGQSKTANILDAVWLNERLSADGIRAFALHPGSIWTELPRSLSTEDFDMLKNTSTFWKSHDQGVATSLVAAFDPKISEQTDHVFLSDCQLEDVATYAKDPSIAKRLFELSQNIVAKL